MAASCHLELPYSNFMGTLKGSEAAVKIVKMRFELQGFGEILHVGKLQGSEEGLLVTYYDPEAAATAKKAFGVEPDTGLLKLSESMSGDESTEANDSDYSPSSPGVFTPPMTYGSLPLFVDEDAQSSAASVESVAELNEVSKTSKPRYVNSLELSTVNWGQLSKKQEWRTALQLRGLPQKLCEGRALEAVLTSAGLMDLVSEVRVTSGPSTGLKRTKFGSAVIHAKSVDTVTKLTKFFHGRQFAGSSLPVAVSFATTQVSSKSQGLSARQISFSTLAEPKRVQSKSITEIKDMLMAGGIQPPPGLEGAGMW